MAERFTFKGWFRDFLSKLLPVVIGIAITFTLHGIVNRSHERKSVQSAMELVRTELTANLKDIEHLTDYMKQEQISAKYLSDHKDDLKSCPKDIVNYHLGQVHADVSIVLSHNAFEKCTVNLVLSGDSPNQFVDIHPAVRIQSQPRSFWVMTQN